MYVYFEKNKTKLKKIKDNFSGIGFGSLFILLLMDVSSLKAAEWKVDGNLNQTMSYDDNVTMREKAEDSFVYAVTPVLNFSHRTDSSEIIANASYGIQRFLNISRLDRNNQNYGIDARYFTETVVWGLSSNYSLTPSRNAPDITFGDVDTDSERETFTISPSVSYKITELDSLLLSTHYTDTSFSTNDFSAFKDMGLNLSWSRLWSERLESSMELFYSNFDSSSSRQNRNQTTNDTFGLNVSSTYQLTDNWKLIGTVGGRITTTESTPETVSEGLSTKDTSAGFLLNSGVNYTGENIKANFKVSKSLIPAAQGQLNDQFRVALDMDYKLTERLSMAFLASYQQSDSVSNVNNAANERTIYTVNPSVSWRLSPEWVLSTSYRYQHQKRSIGSGQEVADSNLIMLSVNYGWPGFSIAR